MSSLSLIYSSEYLFWGLDFSNMKSDYTNFELDNNNIGLSLSVLRGNKLSYFSNTKLSVPIRLNVTNGDNIQLLSTPPLFVSDNLDEHLLHSEIKHTEGIAYKINFSNTTLIPTLGFNVTLTPTGIYKPISKFGSELALYYLPNSKNKKSPFVSFGFSYYFAGYEFFNLNGDEERKFSSSYTISLIFGTAHRWRENE